MSPEKYENPYTAVSTPKVANNSEVGLGGYQPSTTSVGGRKSGRPRCVVKYLTTKVE